MKGYVLILGLFIFLMTVEMLLLIMCRKKSVDRCVREMERNYINEQNEI